MYKQCAKLGIHVRTLKSGAETDRAYTNTFVIPANLVTEYTSNTL